MPDRPLMLQEEVLLLALHARTSQAALGTSLHFALGGALLAELLLEGRLTVDPSVRRGRVRPGRGAPTGDDLLDACLTQVTGRARPASLEGWVARWARLRGLKGRVAVGLSRRGILRVDETKVLRIFRRINYPEIDPAPAEQIRARLTAAIQSESAQVDPRTMVLISLAYHAGLLAAVLEPGRMKERRVRLRSIVAGELTGPAVRASLDAMTAALVAAAVIPVVVST